MPRLIIRDVDPAVLSRLRELAASTHVSLDVLARSILSQSVGIGQGTRAGDDLHGMAGTWSEEEEREFLENIRPFSSTDERLWD